MWIRPGKQTLAAVFLVALGSRERCGRNNITSAGSGFLTLHVAILHQASDISV